MEYVRSLLCYEGIKAMNISKREFYRIETQDENPDTSYLTQTIIKDGVDFSERYEEYKRGDFYFIGVQASIQLEIPINDNHRILQTITSPGLWGVESDSDKEYLNSIYAEECNTLTDMLTTMGIVVTD